MHSNRKQILQWAESGQIDNANIGQIIQIADAEPKLGEWIDYLKLGLLWSAIIAICSGMIFFFAYNWQDISRFTKFSLVETMMLFATITYIRTAPTKVLTTATLMGMSLFTGALLALVGQTYQTGADPWQLFATWALLMLPWAMIGHTSSLWILWVGLVNLAVSLYLEVSHGIFDILLTEEIRLWIFTILNTGLLCAFEYHSFINQKKQDNRYVNQLLASAAGTAISFLAIWTIFEYKFEFAGFIFYVIWITCAFYIYRYKVRDLFILSMGSLSVIIILVSLLLEVIDTSMDDGGFLLISFTIIILSTLAGIWLKNLSKQFAQVSNTIEPEALITANTEAK